MEFRFLAGRVSLAFTATVGERWRRKHERLCEPRDLGRWLVDAGLAPEAPEVSQEELQSARKLREAIYRAAQAVGDGAKIAPRDAARINAAARQPPLAPQLRAGALSWVTDEPVPAALSLVARDALELFTSPLARRIRECASPECALLFVDTSRPGRRRWCSSETCGSRARSAKYRARHTGSEPASP